jgi:hypothetical protein
MSHDYHEGLPGYSPNQLLHDGCGECEARSKTFTHGIGHLDTDAFARAWGRAAEWERQGGDLTDVSQAERPLLRMLWALQIHFERRGVPLGRCPGSLRPQRRGRSVAAKPMMWMSGGERNPIP